MKVHNLTKTESKQALPSATKARLNTPLRPVTALPTVLVITAQQGIYESSPEIVEVPPPYPPSARQLADAADKALAALARQMKARGAA